MLSPAASETIAEARISARWLAHGSLWLLAGCLTASIGFLLYWAYPFDGMILSDSWFLYATQGGEFRWFTQSQVANREPVHHPDALVPFEPSWSLAASRRGLLPFAVLLLDRLSGGGQAVGVNALCVLVQVINAALFTWIAWRLAGAALALFALCSALLYPFAAGSHFWQILFLNNVSVMLFLMALALFMAVDWPRVAINTRTVCLILPSLICYWVSMVVLDYAVFMGPLFWYLALCFSNEGGSVYRFQRWRGVGPALGFLYVVLSGIIIVLFAREAPSFLVYSSRIEELADRFGLPAQLLGIAVVLGNAMLVLLSAIVSNTVGLIAYPLAVLWKHAGILVESWQRPVGIGLAVGVALSALVIGARLREGSEDREGVELTPNQMLAAGTAWTLLAYLPFATAFGYPRVVGLTTDRANVLALWGVALCAGVLVSKGFPMPRASRRPKLAFWSCAFLIGTLLAGNLIIQRETYVEAYRKERQLAELILAQRKFHGDDGRIPVVILERSARLAFPRERLLQSSSEGGALAKTLSIGRFLLDRHFIAEYVTSSFHLDGIMLFGCCPQSADITFDGYARQLGVPRVPVYKGEPPIVVTRDGGSYAIGYANTEAWSKEGKSAQGKSYPADRFEVLRVRIDDSFFQLRGALGYRVEHPVLPM